LFSFYFNISPFDGLLWRLLSPVTVLLLTSLLLVLFLLLLDNSCLQTVKFLLSRISVAVTAQQAVTAVDSCYQCRCYLVLPHNAITPRSLSIAILTPLLSENSRFPDFSVGTTAGSLFSSLSFVIRHCWRHCRCMFIVTVIVVFHLAKNEWSCCKRNWFGNSSTQNA